MYRPECNGSESSIFECNYGEEDTVPRSCDSSSVANYYYYYRSNYDVTSLICLPGTRSRYKYINIEQEYKGKRVKLHVAIIAGQILLRKQHAEHVLDDFNLDSVCITSYIVVLCMLG